MRRWAVVLLFLFLARCSTPTKVFRLDTGQGVPMLYVPHREVEPVEVSEAEFRRAIAKLAPSVPAVEHPLEHARQVFGVPERSGWYRYESKNHRLTVTVVAGMTMYAILLALPEPVTKGLAALLTLGAGAYLGWDTVWRLIDGWLVLMKEVDRATTFDELYAAGEKFGEVMGEKAARAFVMLATAAMGNSAAGMAAKMPTLPGAGQAAVVAEAQMNLRWTAPALAQVESVAITAEGVTIALAPHAVAMAARNSSGGKAGAMAAPPSAGGPGDWVKAGESMPEQARRYQAQVTRAPKAMSTASSWVTRM
ncbi:MAG TPA: hypothetical protein VNA24_31860 [Hyalangium sp.]|nr:hypothetical protein [Hyalangium sp.]